MQDSTVINGPERRLAKIVSPVSTVVAVRPSAQCVTGEGTKTQGDNRHVRIALLGGTNCGTVPHGLHITITLRTVNCVIPADTAALDCTIIHPPTALPVL